MTLNDRLTRGLLAGILAGIPTILTGFVTRFILHATTLLYTDWVAILIYGKKAETLTGHAFSLLVLFMWWGFLGVFFSYAVRYVTSKNMLLKGLLWGGAIWFVSYVITLFFKVPGLQIIPVKTAISQLIGALVWGGLLALIYGYLDRKVKS